MLVGVNLVHSKECHTIGHVEHFLRKTTAKAAQIQTNTRFLLFTTPENHASFEGFERVCVESDAGGWGRTRSAEAALNRALSQHPVEVLFAPLESVQPKASIPTVLLALDILAWDPVEGSGAAKVSSSAMKAIKRACAEAKGIVVTSQYLRRKFLDLFEVPLDKVTVAQPGTEDDLEIKQPVLVAPPYIMLAIDRLTKPNIGLIRSMLKNHKEQFPHTLVIIGDVRDDADIAWGDHVIRFEACPTNVLASLYQHSALFLYPATRDGSAMRVLESLRAGAPVLTTSSGAIAEYAGNAPIFFNASSSAALLQAVRRMLDHDKEKLHARISVGKKTAAPFTWDKTVWKVIAALNGAL